MKPRTFVYLGVAVVILGAAVASYVVNRSVAPIEVVGSLHEQEVRDICMKVRHKMRQPIFSDFSTKNLLEAPRRVLERFTEPHPRIWRMEQRTGTFVAVIGRVSHQTQPDSYVFWCVVKETNGWWVGSDYQLTSYETNEFGLAGGEARGSSQAESFRTNLWR